MLVIIHCASALAPEHSRLMSVSFWTASLEVLREARWWFWSPTTTSCSFAGVLLLAIGVGSCCFCCGALVTGLLLSHRCRQWIWHCASAAVFYWGEGGSAPRGASLQTRFREYRA